MSAKQCIMFCILFYYIYIYSASREEFRFMSNICRHGWCYGMYSMMDNKMSQLVKILFDILYLCQ